MIFHWIDPDLYSYNLHENAEKPGVISFLSQIFCQKAVGLMPLPTRPQRYCDPASLVIPLFQFCIFFQ